jgi:tRNA A37 N6-isopentenylltransferase MiaA
MNLVPISVQDAIEFVRVNHRHHLPPLSGLFAVACAEGEQIVGVAIIGRPVSRMLQDGWTAEVTRLATNGSKNACSMLYGAAWRACRALGYRRLVTYILDTEPGTTLQAAGWKLVGAAGGGSWDRRERPRVDRHPTQGKLRWEQTVEAT